MLTSKLWRIPINNWNYYCGNRYICSLKYEYYAFCRKWGILSFLDKEYQSCKLMSELQCDIAQSSIICHNNNTGDNAHCAVNCELFYWELGTASMGI